MINTEKVVIDIDKPQDSGTDKKEKKNGGKRKTISDTITTGGK